MRVLVMVATLTFLLAGGLLGVGGLSAPDTAQAATSCGFGWAKPGKYRISGNFRGRVESTSARLTRDCRVSLQIPGVFTGGRVKRSGKCLRFPLKVEGERKVFFAKWCNSYGLVPWKGRNIRAKIERLTVDAPATRVKKNYNN